jgi:hypothetical protein
VLPVLPVVSEDGAASADTGASGGAEIANGGGGAPMVVVVLVVWWWWVPVQVVPISINHSSSNDGHGEEKKTVRFASSDGSRQR